MVEAEEFLIDIGDKQILPTIAIKVRGVHSHPGARGAGIAVGHSRYEA